MDASTHATDKGEVTGNGRTAALLEHRKLMIESEFAQADLYDKSLITIAPGAMGISIAFVRFIAPNPIPASLKYLLCSWICLALSLCLTMVSLQISQKAHHLWIEFIDKELRGGDRVPQNNGWATAAAVFNWVSTGLLVLGLVAFAVFSWKNVGSGANQTTEDFNEVRHTTQQAAR